MSTTSIAGRPSAPLNYGATHGQWERRAPWVAPLVTAGLFALATFVMYTSCGAALI